MKQKVKKKFRTASMLLFYILSAYELYKSCTSKNRLAYIITG
jgi:hypothetical protein